MTADRIRAVVPVAADHPSFAGHFPDHPVLPGVVLLDEVVAAAERHLARPLEQVEVKVAKFHAPVAPGAQLCIELGGDRTLRFEVTCDGVRVASGELALRDDAPGAPSP